MAMHRNQIVVQESITHRRNGRPVETQVGSGSLVWQCRIVVVHLLQSSTKRSLGAFAKAAQAIVRNSAEKASCSGFAVSTAAGATQSNLSWKTIRLLLSGRNLF
jgi:hypothetical protein